MFNQINFSPNFNYSGPDECYITLLKIYIIHIKYIYSQLIEKFMRTNLKLPMVIKRFSVMLWFFRE
jgi:hypothetical protein